MAGIKETPEADIRFSEARDVCFLASYRQYKVQSCSELLHKNTFTRPTKKSFKRAISLEFPHQKCFNSPTWVELLH